MGADEVFSSIISPIIQSFWPWNPFSSFPVTNLGIGDSLAIAGSSSGLARQRWRQSIGSVRKAFLLTLTVTNS